jgi:arylsulfatase A-like enzyme
MSNQLGRPVVLVIIYILGLLVLGSCSPAVELDEEESSRPNIIFIIADDLAWDDSGPYGNEVVRTPNLDRLARQGIAFDNAVLTCSSCSPSRSSIITGRYPHKTDAEQLHWPLPAEQITFVELLKESGYYTAAAGKWHLGEEVKGRFDQVIEADVSGFQLPTGEEGKAGKFIEKAVGDARSGCSDWVPTLKNIGESKPYFLWLAALDPHRPYDSDIIENPHQSEEVQVPPYLPDTPESRAELALYYDEITRLDGFIGEVLDEVENRGEIKNTIVVFISDNGRPFPRDKTSIYDSGVKTPLIVRWPQEVGAGLRSEGLVSAVDLAPTFLELAGVDVPPSVQGRSIVPLLLDPSSSIRSYAYSEHNWHDYEDMGRSVRTTRYKYIRNFYSDLPGTPPADVVRSSTYRAMQRLRDTDSLSPAQRNCFVQPRPEEELYDIVSDPYEMENLASDPEYSPVLEELRQALKQWQIDTGDKIPKIRTPDEFDRETGGPLPVRVRPRPSKKEMFPEGR